MRPKHRGNQRIYEGYSEGERDEVRIVMLGGTGNVTKNMYVYEYHVSGKLRDRMIVDCGIGFPGPEMYGVDLIIPDVRYLMERKDTLRGIVFTHGHDDHIGAIPYIAPRLGNIPMWGTKLAAAFANLKLKEAHLKARVRAVTDGETITMGAFSVQYVRVTHSVPDTAHLVIETPVGSFYHGSDFKFDMTPLDGKVSEVQKIDAAGRKGVLCLLTDCLGSERRGFTPSEQIVGVTLEKELTLCEGKFLFTTQSSNISRIQLAIEIAVRHGRKIAFVGRSIDQNVEESVKLGYMRFSRDAIVRVQDLKRVPAPKQFLVVAGSQGQPGSALSRIANDDHPFIKIREGDAVVFSADPIPGNENNVSALIDQLYRMNARVSYSNIMEDLHVSGHGSQGDLMFLLSLLTPSYIVPIGGTYRHMMQYRRLATELGVQKRDVLLLDEGQIVAFRRGSRPQVVDEVATENIMIDGLGIGDVGKAVLRDRQTIATEGIVVVVIPFDRSTGRVSGQPDIISRGFVYMKGSGNLVENAKRVIQSSMGLKKGRLRDWQFVRKRIENNLEQFLRKETGRTPLIVPVVVEV